MAKFRVETQIAIDKASTAAAKASMEGLTKAATQLAGAIVGEKAFVAPFKALKSVIEESIAASEKATASQARMGEAIKNVYKTIGDEMTPGLNQLAASIQQALSNPEIIDGLKTTGQLLSVMATGISAVVDEIASFVGSPAFAKWLQVIYGVDLNTDAMKAYREQGAAVDQITAAVSKWAKGVAEQQKAEEKAAEARRKAHEEHLKNLQAILDKANPIAKAEREAWQQILTLNQAMKAGEIDVATYQDALATVTAELNAIKAAGDLVAQVIEKIDTGATSRSYYNPFENTPASTVEATLTISQDSYTEYERQMDGINEQLAANLESGLTGAFASALVEFANGGKDAMKHFGESLMQILIQAVAEYIAKMLAALAVELAKRLSIVATEAAARQASGAGGGGGASSFVGPLMQNGAKTAMTQGGSSMSGMGTFVAVVAVMAALVAVLKHQTDRANAVRYDTTSGVRYENGSSRSNFTGNLEQTGAAVAKSIDSLMKAFQSATGSFIEGVTTAEVMIRNDKTQFRAIVNGVVVGQFKTVEEAVIAAAKGAFLAGDLSKQLDPIIRSIIEGYKGKDPNELLETVKSVQAIIDELHGLTQIEVELRGLPGKAQELASKLMSMGVAFDDANRLAMDWQSHQMQTLRDQITGHQQTAAEELAERGRQAAMFNAQLALMRAELQMKRDELQARVTALQAAGLVLEADLNLKNTELSYTAEYMRRKLDAFEQDVNIHEWYLTTLGTIGNTSLAILQQMVAALDAQIANLPSAIDLGEIHIRGGHSGGGGSGPIGPTPAEIAAQLAADIADFWTGIADTWRSILPGLDKSIAELNHWYEEQAARATELGIPLAELNDLYNQQLLNLQNDTLASLGLQSLDTIQQFENLTEALKYLRDWGAISEAQIRELGDSMYISLVDSLLQYVDNEDVRRQLEDLRFRMEIANYQLQFQYLQSLGLLTQAEIDVINGLFTDIQAAYDAGTLAFQLPSVNQTQSNGTNAADEARSRAEQALREALDRLRSAVETLHQFQKGLSLSASSPLTTSQQYQEAQRQYMALLAAAQGGDINAMAQLAEAAQTYLDLAAEMFGTSGAGYAAIFDAVSQQVAAIAAMGQQILDSVPPQMAGTEDRLDTIADILRVMAGLGAGGTGGGGNSHAGLVYYGPDWGWHPMGWSPGGNTPPTGNASMNTASLGSAGNLSLGNFSQPGAVTVRAPDLLAKIDQLVTAHQAATVEAKNDRMKKTTPSWSGYHGQPIGSRRSA